MRGIIIKKYLLIITGFLFVALGGIGIFIPVLPTTPFVLVAAICFSASSPKLYLWLSNTKYFGEFITNYKNKSGVRKAVKIRTLIFLYVTLGISFFLIESWAVKGILIAVAIGVTIHILMLKTKSED